MPRPKKPNYAAVDANGQKVVEITLKVQVPEAKIVAIETAEKSTRTGAVQKFREDLTAKVQGLV